MCNGPTRVAWKLDVLAVLVNVCVRASSIEFPFYRLWCGIMRAYELCVCMMTLLLNAYHKFIKRTKVNTV